LQATSSGLLSVPATFSTTALTLSGSASSPSNAVNISGTITLAGLAQLTANGGGNLTIAATGSLAGTGARTLIANSGGNINLNGALTGNPVSMTVSGAGNVNQGAGGIITATTVNLTLDAGTMELTTSASSFTTLNVTDYGDW